MRGRGRELLRCEALKHVALILQRARGESLGEVALPRPVVPQPRLGKVLGEYREEELSHMIRGLFGD